jgi:hypothetical protein
MRKMAVDFPLAGNNWFALLEPEAESRGAATALSLRLAALPTHPFANAHLLLVLAEEYSGKDDMALDTATVDAAFSDENDESPFTSPVAVVLTSL